ncbi:hypothetical protein BV25DRAFT_180256 [Artomyces pyxidatus]|uniref:Uncharacterized protein n=1 Tax=Artomyces pyxidatus TaxID=48021 RepID=A0ACB8SHL8_9AGAM|nr:hypothetical protein BV25DRAFT_180256 [Artomyces pyxidatus]
MPSAPVSTANSACIAHSGHAIAYILTTCHPSPVPYPVRSISSPLATTASAHPDSMALWGHLRMRSPHPGHCAHRKAPALAPHLPGLDFSAPAACPPAIRLRHQLSADNISNVSKRHDLQREATRARTPSLSRVSVAASPEPFANRRHVSEPWLSYCGIASRYVSDRLACRRQAVALLRGTRRTLRTRQHLSATDNARLIFGST